MEEKVRIAARFLVKKQMEENGLKEGLVSVDDEGLRRVIEDYTREVSLLLRRKVRADL